MWISRLLTDTKKTCFVTVPQKWGINFVQLPIIKIQQSLSCSSPVYATCVGENGLNDNENVTIGACFARVNGLTPDIETVFEIIDHSIPIISSVIAEPCMEEDWELLEMNVDQVQSELLNRVRVIWTGANIPIWLSDFVSLSLRIVELEPKATVGLLAPDTEIHVSPPKPQPRIGPVLDHKKATSFKSILSQLLNQHLPKNISNNQSNDSISIQLRVLPVEDKENFHQLTSHVELIMQPYAAFLSNVHLGAVAKFQDYIGRIRNGERTSYFSIHFVETSKDFPIFSNAIYLSEAIIRQLKLNLKQRIEVLIQDDNPPNRCDTLNLYTFVQDYDLKELEKDAKMWLQSVAKDKVNLILNHGQHVDIPCLVKDKTHRLFIGLQKKTNPNFCRIDEASLKQILEKLKIVRIRLNNTPQYLQLLDDEPWLPLKHSTVIGGLSDLLEKALRFLKVGLGVDETNNLAKSFTGCRQGNVLLTGPRGSGRSSIARHLCSQLENGPYYVHTVFVDCSSLKGKRAETLQRDWSSMFSQLVQREPSLLVLDDLDLLVSSPQNNQDDGLNGEGWYYKRIATLILDLVKRAPFSNQVLILATAINGKTLYPTLNNYESSHFFTCELSIPPLTNEMKSDMIRKLFESDFIRIEPNINMANAMSKTDGYVALDIRHLVNRTVHLAASDSGCLSEACVQTKHLELAVADHIPIGLHGISLKPPLESRIAWSDVGGLANAKKLLVETLKWPTQYPELFSESSIRLRSALLLYGAPGTGKTMLARAVATECEVNFISIKGPELLSKYIGASEEAVRETFRRARSAKPCILFFDEFDSLAPRRGHDSTGVTDRVVNQLLTELDGVEGQEVGLWVLAATSRPDLIDPALLRPGRFDVAVRCSMPDKGERLEILKALSSRLHLDDDVQLDEVASETEHFSGADLQAVLYNAQLKIVHERTRESGDKPTQMHITHQLLMNALRETRPSVTASERQRYDRMYENFDSGHSGSTDVNQTGLARVTLA